MEIHWSEFVAKYSLVGSWLDYSSISLEGSDGNQAWWRGKIKSVSVTPESIELRSHITRLRTKNRWHSASFPVRWLISFADTSCVDRVAGDLFTWQTRIGEMFWVSCDTERLCHDYNQLETGRRTAERLWQSGILAQTAD